MVTSGSGGDDRVRKDEVQEEPLQEVLEAILANKCRFTVQKTKLVLHLLIFFEVMHCQ